MLHNISDLQVEVVEDIILLVKNNYIHTNSLTHGYYTPFHCMSSIIGMFTASSFYCVV